MVDDQQPGGGILSIVPIRSRTDSFGVRPPEPAGFWRAVQWELGGMHLMLGSSLPVRTMWRVAMCFYFWRLFPPCAVCLLHSATAFWPRPAGAWVRCVRSIPRRLPPTVDPCFLGTSANFSFCLCLHRTADSVDRLNAAFDKLMSLSSSTRATRALEQQVPSAVSYTHLTLPTTPYV